MVEVANPSTRVWSSSRIVRGVGTVFCVGAGSAVAILTGLQQGSNSTLILLVGASLVLAISWPTAGLRVSWLGLGAVAILLLAGVATTLDQPDLADVLAVGSLFLMFAASVGEILVRRVPFLDDHGGNQVAGERVYGAALEGWRARSDYIVVGAICLIASQTWTDLGSLLAFGDYGPIGFLNPDVLWEKLVPMWNTYSDGLGGRNFTIVNVPILLMSRSMQAMGISGAMSQRVILTSLLTAQGLSMVYFLRAVWPRSRSISRVAGGLFYVFNMFALFTIPGLVQMTAFALLPLLAALMVKGFSSGEGKYVLLYAASSLPIGFVAANPPLVLVVGAGATLVALIFHVTSGGSLRGGGRFALRAIPLVLLLNLWWMVPVVVSLGAGGATNIPVTPEEWDWTQVRNSISNLFTLNSNWAWPQQIYYPYSQPYESAVFKIGSYVPAVLAFGALATTLNRRRPPIAWLALTATLLLFLSKGVHPPFRDVSESLLREIPGFWVLREPASKLLPVVIFIFGILICISMDRAVEKSILARPRPSTVLWGAIVVCGLLLPGLAFPLLSGQFAWAERPVLPDGRISVPHYWHSMANAINSRPSSGALLVLPLSDFYAMPYSWGYYGPDAVPVELIRRPTILGSQLTYLSYGTKQSAPSEQLQQAIVEGNYAKVRWLLRSLGIRYLLVRADIDYEVLGQLGRSIPSAGSIQRVLDATDHIRVVDRIGPLTLYEVIEDAGDLVSVWPGYEVSENVSTLPSKPRLYSETFTSSVSPDEPWVDEESWEVPSDTELPLSPVSLRLVRTPEGVQPASPHTGLLWQKLPTLDAPSADAYVRLDGDLKRIPFHRDGQSRLRLPWGYVTTLEFWSTRANLLLNPSFEEFPDQLYAWKRNMDCITGAERDSAEARNEVADKRRSPRGIRLSSSSDPDCISQIVQVEPLSTYELSLDQKLIRGRGGYCVSVALERRSKCISDGQLKDEMRWHSFVETLTVPADVTSVDVRLYARPGDGQPSAVLVDNVRFKQVELDRIYGVDWSAITSPDSGRDGSQETRQAPHASANPPELRITSDSNARYLIDVSRAEKPFVLTLNQTFDPAWTLSTSSGETLDATHTIASGFANGWLIDRKGDFRLVLEFPLEQYAVLARWGSLAGLLLLLCLSMAKYRRSFLRFVQSVRSIRDE
jgi:hypothetical protein